VSWRTQLPVYSPLPIGAIGSGVRSLLAGEATTAARLRDALAKEFSARQVLLTGSGTTALALAMRAAAGSGAVALPAYGCYDLATAVDASGAPCMLYDLDPGTLGPDWDSLDAALRAGAKAVVAVHLFGVPVDLPAIITRAAAHGAVVIEDAAQGAGALLNGVSLGAGAPLGVLSFGRGKGVTAGRGGALLVRDAAFEESLPAVAASGRGAGELLALLAQWALGRPSLYGIPARLPWLGLGETVYHGPAPLRALSAAALGVLERTRLERDREAEIRRRNAARLLEAARFTPGVRLVRPASGSVPGYLRLPLLLAEGTRAGRLGAESRRLGVMPGYPLSLDALPGFAERLARSSGAGFPGARALAADIITLPTHSRLVEADLVRLERWLGNS
jgi:perosamine synthetase